MSAREGRRREPRARLVVAVLAVLVVAALVDRVGHRAPSSPVSVQGAGNAAAHPSALLSSTWYCAGATASATGIANGAVIISNFGSRATSGTVTTVTSSGRSIASRVAVPARSQVFFQHPVAADYVADTVELDSGWATVAEAVTGPYGQSSAPCSSVTSPQWYFANGSTVQGDALLLFLYNPGATDVVADLSFATDHGFAQPGDFQGVLVPSGSLSVLNVGTHVLDSQVVASMVSARMGSLVVGELTAHGSAPPLGLSLAMGTPAPQPSWMFPFGFVGGGASERLEVLNPSGQLAHVEVDFALPSGSAEPIRIGVQPRAVSAVDLSQQARVPSGLAFSTRVWSSDGTGIVVHRTLSAKPPSPNLGVATMLGARASSTQWSFAPGLLPGTPAHSYLVVQSDSGRAEVSVFEQRGGATAGVAGLTRLRVPPGAPSVVQVPDAVLASDPALVVTSSAPVSVERQVYVAGSPGISTDTGYSAESPQPVS